MRRGTKIGITVLGGLLVGAYLSQIRPDLSPEEAEAKYTNAASRFYKMADRARVHYRDEGNPSGPVLVLLHGSTASLHMFETWIPELGDAFRLISVDLPGHGLTGPVPSEDYSHPGFVAFVDRFVDDLDIDRFSIAGNSMGGGVALRYALKHGKKLEGMILLDSSGVPESEDAETPLFLKILANPVGGLLLGHLNQRPMVEAALRDVVVDQSLVTEAILDRFDAMHRRAGNRVAVSKMFALPHDHSLDGRFSEITVRTLIMHGDQDPLIPLADARELHSFLPNSELLVYENVGHIPQMEIPQRSAADARAFLLAVAH